MGGAGTEISGLALALTPAEAIPFAPLCVPELLAECGRRWGTATAIVSPNRSEVLTFANLNLHCRAMAAGLRDWGIRPCDRIGTLLPAGPECVVAMLGIACCAVYAPLNPRGHREEILAALGDLKISAVILQDTTPIEARAAALASDVPIIELRAVSGGTPGETELRYPATWLRRTSVPGQARAGSAQEGLSGPDDLFSVMQTSGTTARPKVVPLSQRAMLGSVRHNVELLELGPSDRCLLVLPPIYPMGITTVLYSLMAGCQMFITPGFVQSEFCGWIREFTPTWLTAPPAIHQLILLAAGKVSNPVVTPPRFVRSGAAPMPLSLLHEIEDFWQAPLVEAYAMSECPLISSNHLHSAKRKAGSVGLPCGIALAFLSEAGQIVPAEAGTEGEILLRGAGLMSGYEDNPAANAGARVDGFFRTGDVGRMDGDGFLHLVGRTKEMINRGGVKIAPREIEEVVLSSPDISDAVAFAMPDPRLGEGVAVAAVLREGRASTELALRQFAAERLSSHKIPARILFVDELPTGSNGKVLRRGLAEIFALQLEIRKTTSAEGGERKYIAPETPLEDALALIWQKTLGREEPVSVCDGFLELGGDSLCAAAMFAEVERILGRRVPIATLLAAPTVRELAAALSSEGCSLPRTCLVPIQPNGTRIPLFCLSGMYGHVLNFYSLARALGKDQPVYGLQLPELSGQEFTRNIENLAELFLSEVRRVQPQGPYRLLGYSFGGYVAYEMARKLGSHGHCVGSLGLLDTRAPGYPKPRSLVGRATYHFDEFRRSADKTRYLWDRWNSMRSGKEPPTDAGDIPKGGEREPAEVREQSLKEIAAYRVEPYAGRIVLFRAAGQPEWMRACRPDDSMGWRRFATEVEVRTIPGSHGTLLSPAHSAGLAAALNSG
jgi:oxalate---CoA ligase